MTSTVDSVIPLAGAADPTAFVSSANPTARSGISFADICAAQLSQSPEPQNGAPAPALSFDPSVQTGNTTTPANTSATKGSAKNTPLAGLNPALAVLVPLPPIPLALPLNTLPSSPTQPVQSLPLVDSTNPANSGSNGPSPTTTISSTGTTASARLPQGNSITPVTYPPISNLPVSLPVSLPAFLPAFFPISVPTPTVNQPSGTLTSAQNPPVPSLPAETQAPPSSASSASLAVPPNGIGSQVPVVDDIQTSATHDQAPQQITSADREFSPWSAETPVQIPTAPTASEIHTFIPNAPAAQTNEDGIDQSSPSQTPAAQVSSQAQVSPAAVEIASAQAVASKTVSPTAVAPSVQPGQTEPLTQKVQPRSAMPARNPPDQEPVKSSALPAAPSASPAGTVADGSSQVTLQGPGQFSSTQRSTVAVHEISSGVPAGPSAGASLKIGSSAQNTSAVSINNNAAPQPAGNASAHTADTQNPASSSDSSSKNDSGGDSSDSQQHKDSPNLAVAVPDSLPAAPSPAFTIAAPSAQASIPQPSSLPDAGPKSNAQTSAGPSDNAPHSSLPATADAAPTAGASPLQMAQMANKAGQAEMRIGLNTTEFGSVEVRTTVHANDVGVQIGSEKGDLRSLLTPELPGIASTLQQQDLRVTQVSFHQQGFAFDNNSSSFSGGNSQPRSFAPNPQSTAAFSEESSSAEPAHAPEPAVSQPRVGFSILA